MRINHNIASLIGQNSLSSRGAELGRSLERLSTGMRINRASDDAAGLSVSESLRAKVRGASRGKDNAQDAIAMLQIADGSAGQMVDILQRMRELALQSSNDTMTTLDRNIVQKEFDHLTDELDRITNASNYNGVSLLNRGGVSVVGSPLNGSSVLHIGLGTGASGAGVDVTIPPLTLDDLNFYLDYWDASGTTFSPTHTINIPAGQIYGVRPWLNNTHWAGTGTLANPAEEMSRSAVDKVDQAIRSVNSARSSMGAYVNRLEFAIDSLGNEIYNTQDAESRIRDVDFAEETAVFTRSQILSQSATSMLAQANQVPQGVLTLLAH
jgi:flagellin